MRKRLATLFIFLLAVSTASASPILQADSYSDFMKYSTENTYAEVLDDNASHWWTNSEGNSNDTISLEPHNYSERGLKVNNTHQFVWSAVKFDATGELNVSVNYTRFNSSHQSTVQVWAFNFSDNSSKYFHEYPNGSYDYERIDGRSGSLNNGTTRVSVNIPNWSDQVQVRLSGDQDENPKDDQIAAVYHAITVNGTLEQPLPISSGCDFKPLDPSTWTCSGFPWMILLLLLIAAIIIGSYNEGWGNRES